MTIRYHWENIKVNVETDCGGVSPHTIPKITDIDYEYEVEVKVQDIVDYLMPYNLSKNNKHKTEDEVKETKLANFYMTKALDFLIHGCLLSTELDELENDEYFIEFMKERYEELALADFEEMNDAY